MNEKSFKKLPDIFKTQTNEKFFEATFEQVFSKKDSEKFSGFIGRKTGGLVQPTDDYYKSEKTDNRNNYQLEPTVYTFNPESGEDENHVFYYDFINYLRSYKSDVSNHDALFNNTYYSFAPPIDVDKFINYQNYYWLESGPQEFEIAGLSDTDVETQVIGQQTFSFVDGTTTVKLSSGMRVTFPDSTSYTDVYTAECVGRAIVLVEDSEIILPIEGELDPVEVGTDYITIERGSCNNNAWSRTNKWYHKQVLAASFDEFPADAIQAKRPIIEFIKDLEMYNFGEKFKQFVTVYSDQQFGFVQGQPVNFQVDSYQLQNGDTIIFNDNSLVGDLVPWNDDNNDGLINDGWASGAWAGVQFSDPASKYIWEVDTTGGFLNFNPLTTVDDYDTVCIEKGFIHHGRYYYSLSNTWIRSELNEKVKANQPPLFELYDTAGNLLRDELVYPGTNFAGSEIFSYKLDSDNDLDSVLGLPLTFKDLGQISDIVFENDLETNRYTYLIDDEPVEIIGYYYYKNEQMDTDCTSDPVYKTSWASVKETLKQRVIDRYVMLDDVLSQSRKIFTLSAEPHKNDVIAELEGNKLNIDEDFYVFNDTVVSLLKTPVGPLTFEIEYDGNTDPITPVDIQNTSYFFELIPHYAEIKVYDNGVLQEENDFYRITSDTVAELDSNVYLEKEYVLEFFTYTKGPLKENSNGYFAIPDNLEKNPLNDTTGEFSVNDLLLHFTSTINNQKSSSQYRDTLKDYTLGNFIVQHESPLPKGMFLSSNDSVDIIESIRFSSREYTRFKNKLIDKVARMISDGFEPFNPGDQINVDLWLEEALKELENTREHPNSFATTYMIAKGTVYEEEIFSADNIQDTFVLTNFTDLSDLKNVMYVYLDGELKVVEEDYQIIDTNPITVKFNTIPVAGIDNIAIRLYTDSEPAYVPATPSKLGMYPVFKPEIITDTTYQTPVDVIVGHDGSKIPVYGDYRDDVLLEFERRIFNGISEKFRTDYDLLLPFEKIKPGKYRTDNRSLEDFNEVLKSHFYKWASYNKVNFKTNSTVDLLDNKTWNYSGYELNEDSLPGNWKGIFDYYYDTQTPHLTPWEMLGFSRKPTWWEAEYGAGPWPSTDPMWNDIEAGIILHGNRQGVDPLYARPGLASYSPIDVTGALKMPEDIPISDIPTDADKARDWIFGDFSPAEYAWRNSETFPYVVIELLYLLRPADFGERFYNPINSIEADIQPLQVVSADTLIRADSSDDLMHGELNDNGELVVNTGYQNLIADRILFLNRSITLDFAQPLRNINVKLGHKMGGFTNVDTLSLTAESFLSLDSSLVIPVEDIAVSVFTSPSVKEFKYSGMIIRYINGKYQVFGYDIVDSGFYYFPRDLKGRKKQIKVGDTPVHFTIFNIGETYTKNEIVKHNSVFYRALETHTADKFYQDKWQRLSALPSNGGIAVTHYLDPLENSVEFIEYGHKFDSVEEVFNFMIGYQDYLESEGWLFNEVDTSTNKLKNWTESGKQFLFWVSGGVADNSAIKVSPIADSVSLETTVGYPANIEKTYNGVYSILDEYGVLIDPADTRIDRLGDITTVVPPTNYGIYFVSIPVKHTEHIITVNNRTVFNDLVYDPLFGVRQDRLKMSAFRTLSWIGKREAPGYIITEDGKLLPNFENIVQSISDYHNTEIDIDRVNIEETARHLIGFENKEYLENLNLSGDVQFQFYQGMILQKGTIESINKLLRSKFVTQDQEIITHEEWAVKMADFGSFCSDQKFDIVVNSNEFTNNPQLILLDSDVSITGSLSDILVVNSGAIYDEVPAINIVPADGNVTTNATAQAILDNENKIVDVILTNNGAGYTTEPLISIGAEPWSILPWDAESWDDFAGDQLSSVLIKDINADSPYDDVISIDIDDNSRWITKPRDCDRNTLWPLGDSNPITLPHSGFVLFDEVDYSTFNLDSLIELSRENNLNVGNSVWIAKNRYEDWGVYKVVDIDATVSSTASNSVILNSDIIFDLFDKSVLGNILVIGGKVYNAERFSTNTFRLDNSEDLINIGDPIYVMRNMRFRNQTEKNNVANWIESGDYFWIDEYEGAYIPGGGGGGGGGVDVTTGLLLDGVAWDVNDLSTETLFTLDEEMDLYNSAVFNSSRDTFAAGWYDNDAASAWTTAGRPADASAERLFVDVYTDSNNTWNKTSQIRQPIADVISHEDDRINSGAPNYITTTAFGRSIDISADGETAIVSATDQSRKYWTDGAVGIYHFEGRIYIYKKSGSNYDATASLDVPYGNYDTGPVPGLGTYAPLGYKSDSFGTEVVISDDGTRALVSAPELKRFSHTYVTTGEAAKSTTITGAVYCYNIGASGTASIEREFNLYENGTVIDLEKYETELYGTPTYARQMLGNTSVGEFGQNIDMSADGSVVFIHSNSAYRENPADGTLWLDANNVEFGIHRYDGSAWVNEAVDDFRISEVDDESYVVQPRSNLDAHVAESVGNELKYYVNVNNRLRQIKQGLVTPIFTNELIPPLEASGLNFGRRMKMSADGNRLVVGSQPGFGIDEAIVYLGDGNGGWSLEGNLSPTTPLNPSEYAPYDVAISSTGSKAVQTTNKARAYAFTRIGSTWNEDEVFAPSDWDGVSSLGLDFGRSVSMSFGGDVIAVGAPGDSNAASITPEQDGEGAVYVYRDNAGTYVEEQKIVPSGRTAKNVFGYQVRLSGDGNTLIISSKDQIEGSYTYWRGTIHVYTYSGGTWNPTQILSADITTPPSAITNQNLVNFGEDTSISYDGSLIVASQRWDNSSLYQFKTGSALIFRKSGSSWSLDQKITSPDTGIQQFGTSVEISKNGNKVFVGQTLSTVDGVSNTSGSVWVYTYDTSSSEWIESTRIVAEQDTSSYTNVDDFGWYITTSNSGEYVSVYSSLGIMTSQQPGNVQTFNVDDRKLTFSEDSSPPPTAQKGDYWIKTSETGNGANLDLSEFNDLSETWITQDTVLYPNTDAAIDDLGSLAGVLIAVYDETNLTAQFNFYRHNGNSEVVVTTGEITGSTPAQSMSINGVTVSFTANVLASDIVNIVNNAAIPNVVASLNTEDQTKVDFIQTEGKSLVFANVTGTMVQDLSLVEDPYSNWSTIDFTVSDNETELRRQAAPNTGSLHIYERTGSTWDKTDYVTSPRGVLAPAPVFKFVKSISNTAFVAYDSAYTDSNSVEHPAVLYIFNKIDGEWVPEPTELTPVIENVEGVPGSTTASEINLDISETSGTGIIGLENYKVSNSDVTNGALINIARKNGVWSFQTDPFLDDVGTSFGRFVWMRSDYEVWASNNNSEIVKIVYTPQIDEDEEIEDVFIDYRLDETVSNEDVYKTWAVLEEGDPTGQLIRQGTELIDSPNFKNMFVYDLESLNTLRMLPILDPVKGFIPGIADQNIDFKTHSDPARYNNASSSYLIDSNKMFDDTHVGKVWWDLTASRFLFTEQGSNDFRRKNWGKVFPGSSVDVYEWVESTVPPAEYEGDGTPKNTTDYVEKFVFDSSTDTESLKYYFWVKGYTSVPNNIKHRTLSVSEVARIIKNPLANNYFWFAPINQNALVVPDLGSVLSGLTLALQVNYKQTQSDQVKHTEWNIIRENDTFSRIPDVHWNKMAESLSTISPLVPLSEYSGEAVIADPDTVGYGYLIVPDPLLSEYEKYGMESRPRQTMFKDLYEARKVLVRKMNTILSTYCLRDINPDWNVNIPTSTLWTYVDWYEDGWNETLAKPTQQAASITDLGTLVAEKGANGTGELKDNEVIKVVTGTDGRFSFYAYDLEANTPVLIGKEDCAVQINEDAVLNENSIESKKELKALINAFRTDMFIEENDKVLNSNSLFFGMMNYAFSEQRNIDWAFKTSYIFLEQAGDDLVQSKTFIQDPFDNIVDYITEVKPYRTKIRDFSVLRKIGFDEAIGTVEEIRDFVIKLFYNRIECTSFDDPGCGYDGTIYDLNGFETPSIQWDALLWDTDNWDGDIPITVYGASDESLSNTFAMPNPVHVFIGDGTSKSFLLDNSVGGPFENVDMTNIGPFVDDEFVADFHVVENTGTNEWYVIFPEAYPADTEIEIFEHKPINGGDFLQPYQREGVPEELVPLDPIENLVIRVDTNADPVTETYDGLPTFEPLYVITNVEVLVPTIQVYYNGVLQTEGTDYIISFEGTWDGDFWNTYGWNSSIGIKFLNQTHVITDIIEITYSLDPLSYRIHKDEFGAHSYYRNSSDFTTTLAADFNYGDTVIEVVDSSVLPLATLQNPGVIWIGAERIEYYHKDDGTNTITNFVRSTKGTSVVQTHPSGKYVIDGSEIHRIPNGDDAIWVNAYNGLTNSNTQQAEFIKAYPGRSIN